MRIIAGKFKSRRILTPSGSLVRPTTDRVRESVFAALASRLDLAGLRVLDLFAGSGALGLEALSRGAATVTFVESDPSVLAVCRKNARALGVEEECEFVRADAERFLLKYQWPEFDLLFADPPYDWPDTASLPDSATRAAVTDALLVLEHDSRHGFRDHPGLVLSRTYGRTHVTFFTISVDVRREH